MASETEFLAASWWNEHSGAVGLAGLIVTAIGLAAAITFYMLQRETKTLDWQLLTNEPIVTSAASRTGDGGITVLLNGTIQLMHPRLLTVRLMNTGQSEIRPEDFDGFIVITTAPGLDIKLADPVRKREGMRHAPECYWEEHECHVGPALYNRGDWVDIQLLVDQEHPYFEPPPPRPGGVIYPKVESVAVDSVVAGQTRRGKEVRPIDPSLATAIDKVATLLRTTKLEAAVFIVVLAAAAVMITYVMSRI